MGREGDFKQKELTDSLAQPLMQAGRQQSASSASWGVLDKAHSSHSPLASQDACQQAARPHQPV